VSFFAVSLAQAPNPTQGTLYAVNRKGAELGVCPLKNTRVRVDISGFLARVTVVQEFQNDFTGPVEAVYRFPLSQNGAVDNMTMTVGSRVIKGRIMKRAAARAVYEAAKEEGNAAALLDQERPNIFTQSVANIPPGEKIVVEISYVETLKYEDGQYELVFPMVVEPRYTPAKMKAEEAAKILPLPTRPGHDISIEINLDAGVGIESLRSSSHEIETVNLSASDARITLKDGNTIPNKDFILRYDVTGKRIEDAVLAHRDERGGFFTLILQPPDMPLAADRTPKEIVFVLDTSGSMSGHPIEKAKEAMQLSLDGLYPDDTFNIITFAGDTAILFDKPVYATQANMERAREFVESRRSSGGTEMMKAIKAALDPSDSQEHLRIVCFMTDGEVGNDDEIIAEVQKHPKARVFSFGIGDSVNRYLLDKIAQEGNGEHEYVGLNDDGSKAARRFYERVRTPILTDISIDWGATAVSDLYPGKVPDLFSAKPVIIQGRYLKPASGTIRLKGKIAGQEYSRDIQLVLPEAEDANDVLAVLWARTKIDGLASEARKYTDEEDPAEIAAQKKLIDQITQLGLAYNLMTQFTSMVAVEERFAIARGGKPKTATATARRPGKTARAADAPFRRLEVITALQRPPAVKYGSGSGFGVGNGDGNGSGSGSAMSNSPASVAKLSIAVPKAISGGVLNGKAVSLPQPAYPEAARSANASGSVAVRVTIDESGNVISATPVSGHPLFASAATQAARQSRFAPTMLSGQPVKVSGMIVYNFTGHGTPQITTGQFAPGTAAETPAERPADAITPEMLADAARQEEEAILRRKLAEKFHFWVFAAAERLRKGDSAPGPNEEKFVAGGNASIRIILTAETPEVLQKLRSLGFEGAAQKGILAGTIPAGRLIELAAVPEVMVILPRMK
jgi:Ca-activated chloride channel family protein